MQIFMLSSRFGSEDGRSLRFFYSHQHYDVMDTLARYFICNGYAVESKYAEFYRPHQNI